MAKAYNTTRHFLSGKPTNPEESLLQTLSLAREKKADAIPVLNSRDHQEACDLLQRVP